MSRCLAATLFLVAIGCGTGTGGEGAVGEIEAAADRFQRLYNSGLLFFHIDDLDRAERVLREAVSFRGADPKPYFYLARIYLRQKRYARAETALGEALVRDPEFIGASLLLAEVYFQSQRLEEGMRHIEDLLESHPGTAEIFYYRGRMLETLGRLNEAATAYEDLLRRDADHLEGRFHLGLTRMKEKDWPSARREFETVLERDPEHFGALFNLAKVQAALGDEEERVAVLQRFRDLVDRTETQIYRDTQIGFHTNRGVTHFNRGEFAAAIGEFRTVVELNPNLARGYFYLGSCYIALRRAADAVKALLRAREMEPDDGRIRIELGRARALNGDLAGAVESFREAIRLNPYLEMPHYYLAGILESQNLHDQSSHHRTEFERLRDLASSLSPEDN